MKSPLVALALLAVTAVSVNADPHNLENGALIAHYVPDYQGYWDPCEVMWAFDPLTNCEDQINRIDVTGYEEVIWWVVAAFEEEKVVCGCQFGFSDYDPGIMYMLNWHPCYPPDGGLEICSPTWPGPLTGTAVVATGTPWAGNFVPVYVFNVYAYGYGPPGVVQLIPDPSVTNPFGGFGNCASPPERWDAALGGMGVNMDGTWVCWGPQNYVCCVGEECVLVQSAAECMALEGEFHPEWDSCGPPNPCTGTPVRSTSWGRIRATYR
jgi:hypothetical protein